MSEKKKNQQDKNRCSGSQRCRCAVDPYKNRRIAMSSFWDDGADHEHTDDDIYGLICRMEQRQKDYQPLEPKTAQRIVERASVEMEKAYSSSRVIREAPAAEIVAPFTLDEIKMGRLLGSGGFSSVYEIVSFQPNSETKYSAEDEEARQFLTKHARRKPNSGETRYAIKYLRRRLLEKPRKYANGAIDLVMEKMILEKLQHPNILKVRGVSADGTEGFANGRHDAYFIVVDKMKETLEDRVFMWRKKMKRIKRPVIGKLIDRNGKVKEKLLVERLLVAYHIASAMQYLHSMNIIYRDLKPNNVGFDIRGDTKLFDFGLCREMPLKEDAIDGTYKMSGKVGTVRYMAPEVKNKQRYNQKADVYSYALVLYEILMLARPKDKTESQKEAEASTTYSTADDANERSRYVCPCWPMAVQKLMKRAWSEDMNRRPAMGEIRDTLRAEIVKLRDGDASGLEPSARRRSTHILSLSADKTHSTRARVRRASNTDTINTATESAAEGSNHLMTDS